MSEMELHPLSNKAILKGHPWIIKDKFTDRFPKNQLFLKGRSQKKLTCIFLNDPDHPKVKGRVWTTKNPHQWGAGQFATDFKERLVEALNKRLKILENENRDNIYLVFGESDNLPGLNILKLGNVCIFQYQTLFWTREKNWKSICMKTIKEHFGNKLLFGEQTRGKQKTESIKEVIPRHFEVKEYGVNYKLDILLNDFGLFTDMAAIRKKLYHEFKDKEVLNLYSYTGAFSLFPLKAGAKKVDSVDLSKKYLNVLSQNFELNSDLERDHEEYCEPVDAYLKQAVKDNKKYDIIVCDPPSSSTDGKKRTSAFKEYPELLKLMSKLLKKGGKCLVFLNTHKVTQKQFEEKLKSVIDKNFKIEKRLRLSDDCRALPIFPEGNYLKGLLLERN